MTVGDAGISAAPMRKIPAIALNDIPLDRICSIRSVTTATQALHVAVIDSHSLTRESMTSNLSYFFDSSRVTSFPSVSDFTNRTSGSFGIVIFCLHASEYEPLELIGSLRQAPDGSALFLISDLDYQTGPEFMRAAWRLGARGFVSTKTTSLTLTLSAIRFVQSGGFFAPADALFCQSPAAPGPSPNLAAASGLTAREATVLELVKEGKTNKVIARELRLSGNTVKVHVHNILRKMHASSRMEAASRACPAVTAADEAALMMS